MMHRCARDEPCFYQSPCTLAQSLEGCKAVVPCSKSVALYVIQVCILAGCEHFLFSIISCTIAVFEGFLCQALGSQVKDSAF